ncbi:MAG: hypothetical protein EA364_10320 [Balneolaceae bacterium]|nr:MAG: hypothetical protein EA364_10320 [Balneolaceae bacterium]
MFIGIGAAFPARDIPCCLIILFLQKLRTMIQLFEKYVNKFILIKFLWNRFQPGFNHRYLST